MNLDYNKNNKINYNVISKNLKKINLSHNSIVYHIGFIATLLDRAKKLEELDFSYQSHRNEYESQQIIITEKNELKILNVSGNKIQTTFKYIPDIIKSSQSLSHLIIKGFNLQNKLKKLIPDKDSLKNIEFVDISENDTIDNIESLNNLEEAKNFHTFIATNTCLNNYLLDQLKMEKVFSNLTTLNFSGNVSILDFSFFNKLFDASKKLKDLNLSKMRATKE
jgi:hypothetical protein